MRAILDNKLETSASPKGMDKHSWLKIGSFCTLLILYVILKSVLNGKFGVIGNDNDDVLRLVQIKDYLSGQSWFNTDQYRMGPGIGTDMHWSRLPDVPIIALTHVFDIFLPQDKALSWAYSIWPPLTSLLLILGVMIGVKNYGGEKANIFACILLAVFIANFYRYLPGSIDHHNLQIGFMALAIGLILDRGITFKSYFLAGLSVAMTIAIGAEIYIFAAIICAYVAISWAFHGHISRRGTVGYGAGLFLGLLTAFLITIPSSEYGVVYCDALSSVTLLASAVGGLGLASIAFFSPKFSIAKSKLSRLAFLAVLGLICGLVLWLYAPQCLSNPLDSLPQDVKTLWLDNVTEAKSTFNSGADKWIDIPMALGAPCIALLVLGFMLKNEIKEKITDSAHFSATAFQFALLLSALAMTIYQIRYFTFAYVFSIITLSVWTARIYVQGKKDNSGSVLYLLALVMSVQLVWVLPGAFFKLNNTPAKQQVVTHQSKSCMSDAVIDVMNSLPQGLVSANPNITGPILMRTKHKSLGGNYHRNWKGIQEQINISISEPAIAKQILSKVGVDYFHYCKADPATRIYAKHNSKGLLAEIDRGNIPRYLNPVSGLENSGVQIFKFVKPITPDGQ